MRFTKSQRELLDAALAPVEGFEIQLVKLESAVAGVTYVCSHAQRESQLRVRRVGQAAAPLCLKLNAISAHEAVVSLAVKSGRLYGCSMTDTLCKCFSALAARWNHRPLCLLLDRAGVMGPRGQDRFRACAEWAAEECRVDLRLVYLIKRERGWSFEQRTMLRDFWISADLARAATEWSYSAAGLDEILGGQAEESEVTEERAIRIA